MPVVKQTKSENNTAAQTKMEQMFSSQHICLFTIPSITTLKTKKCSMIKTSL